MAELRIIDGMAPIKDVAKHFDITERRLRGIISRGCVPVGKQRRLRFRSDGSAYAWVMICCDVEAATARLKAENAAPERPRIQHGKSYAQMRREAMEERANAVCERCGKRRGEPCEANEYERFRGELLCPDCRKPPIGDCIEDLASRRASEGVDALGGEELWKM